MGSAVELITSCTRAALLRCSLISAHLHACAHPRRTALCRQPPGQRVSKNYEGCDSWAVACDMGRAGAQSAKIDSACTWSAFALLTLSQHAEASRLVVLDLGCQLTKPEDDDVRRVAQAVGKSVTVQCFAHGGLRRVCGLRPAVATLPSRCMINKLDAFMCCSLFSLPTIRNVSGCLTHGLFRRRYATQGGKPARSPVPLPGGEPDPPGCAAAPRAHGQESPWCARRSCTCSAVLQLRQDTPSACARAVPVF